MYRLKQLTLLLGDILTLYIGLYVAVFVRYLEKPDYRLIDLLAPMGILFLAGVIIMFIAGLYDITRARNAASFFKKIALAAGIWIIIGVLYFYVRPNLTVTPKTILLLTALFGFGLLALWRFAYNKFLSTTIWLTDVVLVGINPESIEIATYLHTQPEHGYRLLGWIATDTAIIPPKLAAVACYNNLTELINTYNGRTPGIIVISPAMAHDTHLLTELYKTIFQQTSIISLEEFYEKIFNRIPPFIFSESWFITHLKEQEKKVYDRIRILIDYLIGTLVGLFFVVTFPLIALIIKLESAGPVLFKQKRVGRLGQPFTMYKYRTMKALTKEGSAEVNGPQYADTNDLRITSVGKFLRRTRLDELPQCINVLRGEMALIGPRPERPEFVEKLTAQMPFYTLRHLVKPGLTGWAQLQKSYYGTIEENLLKLQYDLYYVKNRGFVIDLSILLHTINVVVRMIGR